MRFKVYNGQKTDSRSCYSGIANLSKWNPLLMVYAGTKIDLV